MVCHSKSWSRRVRRIIGSAAAALLAGPLAGCLVNPETGHTASAPRVAVTQLATPAPAGPGGVVYVLSPVGLNVRAGPGAAAERVGGLSQGSRLDVLGTTQADGRPWLHVRSRTGALDGWVLDDQELVIHREMAQHVESSSGYSNLFPAEWTLHSGNPATMESPTGDADPATLLVQSADSLDKLAATPVTAGGRELRQESPILVYGKTTYLTIYMLPGAGFEFVVKAKFEHAAYLFDYRQGARPQPDTALFKTLLASVIVP